jgi:hypothetical protein
MFDKSGHPVPDPEVVARLDAMVEEGLRRAAQRTPDALSRGWIEQVCAAARVENRAAAAQLVALGQLFAYRLSQGSETEDWAMDTMEAVAAEVAAGLRISQRLAASRLGYAREMRERLPQVGAVFQAGEIDYRTFQTIVYRTELIADPDILARVDAIVATNVGRWPSMTWGRLSGKLDAIVARVDADAVRRRTELQTDREVWIGGDTDGISQIEGTLLSPDAHALDARLSALAATVCPQDPRTTAQRRADALGALAAGADRLGCRCGLPECAAGSRRPASPVTIHVIAEQATLDGTGTTAASELNADGLITPELLAQLALTAKLVPLVHPGDAPPEPGYVPSKALAEFVRCRGSDVPLAGLRSARDALRPGSHHPVRPGRQDPCREFEMLLQNPPLVEEILGPAGQATAGWRHSGYSSSAGRTVVAFLVRPNTPEGTFAMPKITARSIVALTAAAAVLIAGAAVANADPADIPPMQRSRGDYVGDWQRHLSTMTIAPDGTGTILLGSSARDGERWTMRWTQGDGLGLAIRLEQRLGAWGDGLDGDINEQTAWKAELVVAPDGVTVLHLAHNDAELTDAHAGDIWCSQKYGYSRFCGA